MNSHIQLPKCIIKNFTNGENLVFCYNVKNNKIEGKRAKNVNTQNDYYSKDFEGYLSNEIETPIGKIIHKLKKRYDDLFTQGKPELTKYDLTKIKQYVYGLLSRSPDIVEQVENNSSYSNQQMHDIIVDEAYKIANKRNFLNSFKIKILFCKDTEEFILPFRGACSYKCAQIQAIIVPLTKKIAIYFCKGEENNQYLYTTTKEFIEKINEFSLKQQIDHGYGGVCCGNKKLLEDIVTKIKYA